MYIYGALNLFFFRKKTANLINMCCKQPLLQPALNYADYSLGNDQIFVSPQVKQSVIINDKHSIRVRVV